MIRKHVKRFVVWVMLVCFLVNCASDNIIKFESISKYEESIRDTSIISARFLLPENECGLNEDDEFEIFLAGKGVKVINITEKYNNRKELKLMFETDKSGLSLNLSKWRPFRYGCNHIAGSDVVALGANYDKDKKVETVYSANWGFNIFFFIFPEFVILWPMGAWPMVTYQSSFPVKEVVGKGESSKESKEVKTETKVSSGKFKSKVSLKNGKTLTGVEVVVTSDSVVVMTEDGTSTVYKKSEVVSVKK